MPLIAWLQDYATEGLWFGLALGVIAAGAVLMPAAERSRLRLAAALLGAHLVFLTLHAVLPDARVDHVARLALWLSLARSSFLVVMDGIVERRLGREVPQIFRDLLQVTLFVLVGMAALSEAGVNLSSLLATSAVITAVIGLSLQETLGNTIAGLAMQAQPPFAIGDWIEVDGQRIGMVTTVGWRAITIWTNDHVEITLPNSMVAKGSVVNFSRPNRVSRRRIAVSAPYSAPPHHVEAVLLDAVVGVPGVLTTPPAQVFTVGFGASGMEYELRFFLDAFQDRDPIESLVRDRIWYAFRRENLSIPYPTTEVYLHEVSEHRLQREAEERVAERVEGLRNVDFLAELPEAALRDLALSARRKPYAAGEVILQQGDGGDEFFVIRRGEVSVMSGAQQVAKLGEGQFFGEMSLMTGAPRAATIMALSAVELVVINKPSMQEVLQSHPNVVERITAVLARRRHDLSGAATPDTAANATVHQRALVSRIRDFFTLS